MREDTYVALLVGVGAAAGVLLGYALANRIPLRIEKDWIDIVTAVGTAGAALVALWFGSTGTRAQRTERRYKAQLAAAWIDDDLMIFEYHAKELRTSILVATLGGGGKRPDGPFAVFSHSYFGLTKDLMGPFVDVSPALAVQLARSIKELGAVKDWIDTPENRMMTAIDPGFATVRSVWARQSAIDAVDGIGAARSIVARVLEDVERPQVHLRETETDQ